MSRLSARKAVVWMLALFVTCGTHAFAQQRNLQAGVASGGEARVALVIGNAAYQQGPLRNPVNDARAISERLQRLGFTVIRRENMKSKEIGSALREFRSRLSAGAVALFFYAGHGLQVSGVNYLPAVDAEIEAEEDVYTQALDVNKVLEVMEQAKTRVNLVFLDACRNNPFSRRFRSAANGLAKVDAAASGTLISFATRPGSVAADGDGKNGLYTEHLLRYMEEPGLPVEQVLKRTGAAVKVASKGRQEPWSEGLIEGDFFFRPGGSAPAVATPATPLDPHANDRSFWESVKDSRSADELKAYLAQYPNGLFVSIARTRLKTIEAAPQPAVAPVSATPAAAAPIAAPVPVVASISPTPQTISAGTRTPKIGFITSLSGPGTNAGQNMERAVRLYLKQHPAFRVEMVVRDDGGVNPDAAKRLAEELVVRDRVDVLAGVVYSPNALAIAPVASQAKVPFVVMNAATPVITTRSPYIARTSFTTWQSTYVLGKWSATRFKRVATLVSDFGPGIDMEAAFQAGFKAGGGGEMVASLRVPLSQNSEWSSFLQRVQAARPEALMAYVPAGKAAGSLMRDFKDLGLARDMKLIGPGDLTADEELSNMGDAALGVLTVHHYSTAATRAANQAFIAAWKREYGAGEMPTAIAVSAYDGMAAIEHALSQQGGRSEPDRTMALLSQFRFVNSPRGEISIDPATRDIVHNEYLREVRRVGGQLMNVEIETVASAVKDPWKALQK